MKLQRTFALALVVATTQCWTQPNVAPLGYENNEDACHDNRDNDRDGLVDCDDDDCLMRSTRCTEIFTVAPQRGHEDNFVTCTDGIDNDDNGQFDCGDRACQNIGEVCCSREFSMAVCMDGRDNDGNGYADCADFSCRNGHYAGTACARETACFDGEDNDGDGRVDCLDRDCVREARCCAPSGAEMGNCRDGRDNDCNGYVDCDDNLCNRDPQCCVTSGAENTRAACSDGRDNDCNGYADCDDRLCTDASRGAPADAIAYCATRHEDTAAACADGLDNDGNGYTDCADRSCTDSSAPLGARQACFESALDEDMSIRDGAERRRDYVERLRARCSVDTTDDDGDGFTNCDDWDCSWNPDVVSNNICPGPRVCAGLAIGTGYRE